MTRLWVFDYRCSVANGDVSTVSSTMETDNDMIDCLFMHNKYLTSHNTWLPDKELIFSCQWESSIFFEWNLFIHILQFVSWHSKLFGKETIFCKRKNVLKDVYKLSIIHFLIRKSLHVFCISEDFVSNISRSTWTRN